jgi:hypothetical protein
VYTEMEWWTRLRLEVLRSEGIGWETLKKILAHPEPPGYRLKEPRPKPKIGAYLERIAQIIEEDKALPKKQRHTAKRIYERIREMGYGGKYTQVKDAVRDLLRVKQEGFMPLIHRVGEADFGYTLAKAYVITILSQWTFGGLRGALLGWNKNIRIASHAAPTLPNISFPLSSS